MDWLPFFREKFQEREELLKLKEDKFHGSLILNFSDGVVINCKLNMNIIPTQKKGG